MIPSPTTFGLDIGPSDPNNNGPERGFPDTNIYLLFLNWEQLQNTRPHHSHLSERFKERGITQ